VNPPTIARDLTGAHLPGSRLVALRKIEPDSRGRDRYLCRCACGEEVRVLGQYLEALRVASCGCELKARALMNQKERLLAMLKAGPVTTGDLFNAFPAGHGQLVSQLRADGHAVAQRPLYKGRRGMSAVWEYTLSL
jgi:hypothetical protein